VDQGRGRAFFFASFFAGTLPEPLNRAVHGTARCAAPA
jgi:hypothetical protein